MFDFQLCTMRGDNYEQTDNYFVAFTYWFSGRKGSATKVSEKRGQREKETAKKKKIDADYDDELV